VIGTVLCADTGKPARFANVAVTPVPQKRDTNISKEPLEPVGHAVTDMEGRFRLEAVAPGHYYVFAWMPGYLDPAASLNYPRLDAFDDNRARQLDAIKQWKEHMVEVKVRANHEAPVLLSMERAAEIAGTVTYEDGPPASGMHFDLQRRVDEKTWTKVGMGEINPWVFHSRTDSHGRFQVSDLLPGEYRVCATFPAYDDETPAAWCVGDTYRIKHAEIIKLNAGEVKNDVNLVVPISGMHTVSGTVTALATGKTLNIGTVRLLYADDRETARELKIFEDGGFVFDYVPEDGFILQFADFLEREPEIPEPPSASGQVAMPKESKFINYADREIRLDVQDDMKDLTVALAVAATEKKRDQKP
jgi:hypothetical protein